MSTITALTPPFATPAAAKFPGARRILVAEALVKGSFLDKRLRVMSVKGRVVMINLWEPAGIIDGDCELPSWMIGHARKKQNGGSSFAAGAKRGKAAA
jgi:hypothetical protein